MAINPHFYASDYSLPNFRLVGPDGVAVGDLDHIDIEYTADSVYLQTLGDPVNRLITRGPGVARITARFIARYEELDKAFSAPVVQNETVEEPTIREFCSLQRRIICEDAQDEA